MSDENSIPESFVAQHSPATLALWNNRNYKWEDIKVGDLVLTMRGGFGTLSPCIRKVQKKEKERLILTSPEDGGQYMVFKFIPASVTKREDLHFWQEITPVTEDDIQLPMGMLREFIFKRTGFYY